MDSQAAARYLAILEAKRAELLASLAKREGIAIEKHADPADNVWQMTAIEVAAGTLDNDTELLRQVEAAIERALTEEYGLCLAIESCRCACGGILE